jgi:hypothetical protein
VNQAIIDVARAEAAAGITEYPPGSNRVKYWDWWTGQPDFPAGSSWSWCAAFVSWCAAQAGTPLPPVNGDKGFTYCPSGVEWAHRHGETVAWPEPGDVVIYSWYSWGYAWSDGLPRVNDGGQWDGSVAGDHTGILVAINDDGTIIAIEGNTSGSGSQDNGGAVLVKRRPASQVCCWWRPASFVSSFSSAGTVEPATPAPVPRREDDVSLTVYKATKRQGGFNGRDAYDITWMSGTGAKKPGGLVADSAIVIRNLSPVNGPSFSVDVHQGNGAGTPTTLQCAVWAGNPVGIDTTGTVSVVVDTGIELDVEGREMWLPG